MTIKWFLFYIMKTMHDPHFPPFLMMTLIIKQILFYIIKTCMIYRSKLWSLGRMLLSSNIIHIWVRVVMLVGMILTCLPTAVRVKSYPGMHKS